METISKAAGNIQFYSKERLDTTMIALAMQELRVLAYPKLI